MTNFDKLVSHFIDTNQIGDYNKENFSITLYDIGNKPSIIKGIRRDINKITTDYKLIVLHPTREYTNIKILDIDL